MKNKKVKKISSKKISSKLDMIKTGLIFYISLLFWLIEMLEVGWINIIQINILDCDCYCFWFTTDQYYRFDAG